jgi:hypothetical protein
MIADDDESHAIPHVTRSIGTHRTRCIAGSKYKEWLEWRSTVFRNATRHLPVLFLHMVVRTKRSDLVSIDKATSSAASYLRLDQMPVPPILLYQLFMTPALDNTPAIHDVYHISVPDRREPMSYGDDRRSVR